MTKNLSDFLISQNCKPYVSDFHTSCIIYDKKSASVLLQGKAKKYFLDNSIKLGEE